MKRCSFMCVGWWPFLVFPLLLLLLFALFQWRTVEKNVLANAGKELLADEEEWIVADTHNRGRDVLLSGVAPSQQAVDAAISSAASAEGVRVVDFVGEIAEPIAMLPPELTIEWSSDGDIILTGFLDSQASVDAADSQAEALYGLDRVVNRLDYSQYREPLNSMSEVLAAARDLDYGDRIRISDATLLLEGEVPSSQIAASTYAAARAAFPGAVSNLLRVTPTPPPVENDQCEALIADLLSEAKINFETAKASITVQSIPLLGEIAAVADRCPDANFEVAGHTDSAGELEMNMALSEARASAVVNRLLSFGLPAERFTAVGYGPSQPTATNATAAGRAQNRRIEFKIKD